MHVLAESSSSELNSGILSFGFEHDEALTEALRGPAPVANPSPIVKTPTWRYSQPSRWSRSGAKRLFDCAMILLALPVIIPLFLLIALAVRLTSRGPILFLQKRIGQNGNRFTIFKFRTMIHAKAKGHQPVTTAGDQRFTLVGPVLRRWKLDEVPQLFNVLIGHMSLVGPRPKVPEHVSCNLPYRPGITGAATIAFAQEELVLERVPKPYLNAFYNTVVLPAKRCLDSDYMASATFSSDLKLIWDSILRKWDCSIMDRLLNVERFESKFEKPAVEVLTKTDGSRSRSASASHGVFLPENIDAKECA